MMVINGFSGITALAGLLGATTRTSDRIATLNVPGEELVSVSGITVNSTTVAGLVDHIRVTNNAVVIDEDFNYRFPEGATIIFSVYTYFDLAIAQHARRTIFPADMCSWSFEYDGRNYEIYDAQFHPGNGTPAAIADAELGYIGKSGRFVKIAN